MVGEARRKQIEHQRIRNGEFKCVYCGGIELASEPDHMPPRILFSRKQRPNDLVFPSCRECNRGSSPIDTITAWLGRCYPNSINDPKEREEVLSLGGAMIQNFPEVASALYGKQAPLTLEQHRLLRGMAAGVNVDDPYIRRVIESFGAKFGLGMHWRLTGQCVSPEGRVYPKWFTNYQAVTGRIPSDLFRVFPNPLPLMQGKLNTAGRFEHTSVQGDDYTTHLAIFGQAFVVLSFVSPNGPELNFAAGGAVECEPGCLKVGYPYGLPRLSDEELAERFARMHGP